MKNLLNSKNKKSRNLGVSKSLAVNINAIYQSKFTIYVFILLLSCMYPSLLQAQEIDTTKTKNLEEVVLQAVRVNEKIPVTFSNMKKEEIAQRNLGQDIPVLLNYLPSVVSTSDAGNGVGYTSIRVRGSDNSRINVTINGIPYNDAESSGTYFVDLPDFASSLESIQLQRGVGTSTNGAGAFGASLNLQTNSYTKTSNGEIANTVGSFNTRKHTLKFSTGLMNDHFEISGRLSNIASNGYIERAKSNLKSYFLQGSYVGKTTLIKALVFGGTEKTYQAWNGIDAEKLATDRTYNYSGQYTDNDGNIRFYDNETDNYQQDHYQLLWNEQISNSWTSNIALHYTKGKGYYENYREDASFQKYGLNPTKDETNTDLITQKWLDNDFYGTTFSVNYKNRKVDFIVGGGANRYEGRHFGKVIWARFAGTGELGDKYYNNIAYKNDANIFAKANCQITSWFSIFGDIQYRNIHYKVNTVETGNVNDTFKFLNPKAGLNFTINNLNTIYASYAKAHKEPNRTDYENGNPKPESLDDFELGWRFTNQKIQFNLNGFFMLYKDQLVLTGALDDVGSPLRTNIGKSYRIGVELEGNVKIHKKWSIAPNITLSENKNLDFYNTDGFTTQSLGNTTIAYSPKIIAGNIITFTPLENLKIITLSKYVGNQFLNNINDENSKLTNYFVQDLNISYDIKMKKIFKSINLNLLANNILNRKYVSNGADYGDGYIYYYPQAGSNFLLGMNLKF